MPRSAKLRREVVAEAARTTLASATLCQTNQVPDNVVDILANFYAEGFKLAIPRPQDATSFAMCISAASAIARAKKPEDFARANRLLLQAFRRVTARYNSLTDPEQRRFNAEGKKLVKEVSRIGGEEAGIVLGVALAVTQEHRDVKKFLGDETIHNITATEVSKRLKVTPEVASDKLRRLYGVPAVRKFLAR